MLMSLGIAVHAEQCFAELAVPFTHERLTNVLCRIAVLLMCASWTMASTACREISAVLLLLQGSYHTGNFSLLSDSYGRHTRS